MKKKFDYEQSVLRLEEIVTLLEKGELSLEESMRLFEEGTKLSAACYDILNKAEQKITLISEKEEELNE
ncbi:MAG: exodeoxyribonuclease VII small subunit [Clostridia bacterium]|nr:exodeoxyribonuclease VII small subunit [Clostridia bacterium]